MADETRKMYEREGGRDPFQVEGKKFAAAHLAAHPPAPPAPESPAPAPSWLDRIAGVFGRKKVEARASYGDLLKKAEIDGKPLSDEEVTQMAEAMQAAGVTEAQAAEHKELIRRWRENAAGGEKLPALQDRQQQALKAVGILDAKIEELLRERLPHAQTLQDLSHEIRLARGAASQAGSLRLAVDALFGA